MLWRLTTGWRRFSGTAGSAFDPLWRPRTNRPIGVAEARAEPVVSRIQRRHDRHFRPFLPIAVRHDVFLTLATTTSLLRYATRHIHYADAQLCSNCMMQILQAGRQADRRDATGRRDEENARRTPTICDHIEICTTTSFFIPRYRGGNKNCKTKNWRFRRKLGRIEIHISIRRSLAIAHPLVDLGEIEVQLCVSKCLVMNTQQSRRTSRQLENE